jgi:hypothetical protein
VTLASLLNLPGVSESVSAAESAVTAVQLSARRRSSQLADAAGTAAGVATAALEECDTSLGIAVVAEANQVARLILQAPLQAIARLHLVAGADEPLEDRGRPIPEFSEGPRLTAIGSLISSSANLPAVIVAAVVHGELATLSPFRSANGLVARGAWRAVMIGRGLDPTALAMPEVGLNDLGRSAMLSALESYRSGTSEGVAIWLRHCALSVEHGAKALDELIRRP